MELSYPPTVGERVSLSKPTLLWWSVKQREHFILEVEDGKPIETGPRC
jgi:hypothetical protein